MEMKFIDYAYKENLLNIKILPATIIGITGPTKQGIIDIIRLKTINKGQIIIDGIKLTKEKINKYKKKITYVEKNFKSYHQNILNIMNDYIKRHNLIIKDPTKKIKDSLKIVGLEERILERDIKSISSSETKLLQISMCLLSNPEVIILDDTFKFLDKQNEKKLNLLIQRLKEQFKKTIIIVTEDSNILYKYTTEMVFIKNDEIFLSGPTNEVYLRVDNLKKNKFEIPDIVEFTYIAKKKKEVKIDYHKDVRDIIKDIYKHI